MHRCAYTCRVAYEWDPKKAASNLRKHKVDFADAVTVFEHEFAVTIDDDEAEEKRFVTIGMDALARVLVIVSHGGDTISASYLHAKPALKSGVNTKRDYE